MLIVQIVPVSFGRNWSSALCFVFCFSSLWCPICVHTPLSGQGLTSSREATQTFWATKGTHPLLTL